MSFRPMGSALLAVAILLAPHARVLAQADRDEEHFVREGWYVDADGQVVGFDWAYATWSSPERHERQWLRSLLWAGALLGFGTTWYWANADLNRLDWDFPDLGDRLSFEAVRFDDNRFTTNNLLHPMAGTGYYGLSRVNGLRVVESFLVAFLASALWEYAFEWREKVSINDTVFTPGAGVVLGEWLFQLGEWATSAPRGGGAAQRTVQWTVGFPRSVHRLLDGPAEGVQPPPDELGFSSAYWHRFRIAYEAQNVESDEGNDGYVHAAVIETEIASVPGYMRPGEVRLGFANGNFTRLSLRMGLDDEGWEDVDLSADATLAGYLVQSLDEGEAGGLHGHSTMVGFDVGYTYQDRWLLGRRDQWSTIHVVGPRSVSRVALGGAWLELDGRLHADFTGARSLAFDAWAADHGTDGIKSILDKRGYYYGLGFSGRLAAALRLEGGFVDAEVEYAHVDSVEGLDREQERVTRDVSADDHRLEYRLGVGFSPPRTPLELRVGHEGLHRWSDMADVREYRWDRRWTASLGFAF